MVNIQKAIENGHLYIYIYIVDLPRKNGDFPQLWDSLPEGISWIWTYQQHAIFIELDNGTIETGNPDQF